MYATYLAVATVTVILVAFAVMLLWHPLQNSITPHAIPGTPILDLLKVPLILWLVVLVPWLIFVAVIQTYFFPSRALLFGAYVLIGWLAASFYLGWRGKPNLTKGALGLAVVGVVVLSFGLYDRIANGKSFIDAVVTLIGVSAVILALASVRTQINLMVAALAFVLATSGIEIAMRRLDTYQRLLVVDAPDFDPVFHHNYKPNDSFVRYPYPLDEFQPVSNEVKEVVSFV